VLDYAVIQRRKEIGIRLALGANASHIATRLTSEMTLMIAVGAAVGLTLGLASETYIAKLLYRVKGTDAAILVTPLLTLLAVALIATLPPIWRAVRIDPVSTMRSE
jgi:putative ABC transport system permease protein